METNYRFEKLLEKLNISPGRFIVHLTSLLDGIKSEKLFTVSHEEVMIFATTQTQEGAVDGERFDKQVQLLNETVVIDYFISPQDDSCGEMFIKKDISPQKQKPSAGLIILDNDSSP